VTDGPDYKAPWNAGAIQRGVARDRHRRVAHYDQPHVVTTALPHVEREGDRINIGRVHCGARLHLALNYRIVPDFFKK